MTLWLIYYRSIDKVITLQKLYIMIVAHCGIYETCLYYPNKHYILLHPPFFYYLFKHHYFPCYYLSQGKVPDVLYVIPPETHRKGDPGPPGSIQGFFITCPQKDNTTGHAEHHCVTRDQCGRVCTHKSSVPCIADHQEVSVVLQVRFHYQHPFPLSRLC